MRTSVKRLVAQLALECCVGFGSHGTLAQTHRSPSELLRELQSEQTSDTARDELLKFGKSDPELGRYLSIHLPPLIQNAPRRGMACSGTPCPWKNAVVLAGNLKIAEAAPALAEWISWREPDKPAGLSLEGRLVFYPAAKALVQIGDPAVPAIQNALDNGNPSDHYRAVRVLCNIHSAKTKEILRDDLPRESDPGVQAMIKRVLVEK